MTPIDPDQTGSLNTCAADRPQVRAPKLLFMALLTGLLGGGLAGSFAWMERWLTDWRLQIADSNWWSMILMVIAAAICSAAGFWLLRRFAPEAGGSGIPEVEGALDDIRPVRWLRVLPVKFIAGLSVLGSGMILGREGPSVQMGAYSGKLVADTFRLGKDGSHILLAAGAAAGLAAAFNAPLAGILFIVEEMRLQFRYGLVSIKSVFIGAIIGTLVVQMWVGQSAVLTLPLFHLQPLESLWLYLVLGTFFGFLGIIFNRTLVFSLDRFATFVGDSMQRFVGVGAALGALAAILTLINPNLTGGGLDMINEVTATPDLFWNLLVLFVLRFILTMLYYGSGATGGIFAPMLALGTLAGLFLGQLAHSLFPDLVTDPGVFAIAGMGALFAATVRAPLTGTVLVLEMTDNYSLILPMIITCLGATMVAQWLGGQPIYSQLLARTLAGDKKKAQAAKAGTHTTQNDKSPSGAGVTVAEFADSTAPVQPGSASQ